MYIRKPNRMRSQSADHHEAQQKASGDQHILPIDEPDGPHRPHRTNRVDMNKISDGPREGSQDIE